MNIGKYNKLSVARMVDFGLYLADEDGNEVLLPARYITGVPEVGDEMTVFVYMDSEGRPVATTEHPFAEVDQVAFLSVVEVNKVGAFLDWGLQNKNLLCPFREQKMRMHSGMMYPVYIYLDHASGRVACSAKIEKYIDNLFPRYRRGDKVRALVYKRSELGYICVVDNKHSGMIYYSSLYSAPEIGETIEAHVAKVRSDGKIDIVAGGDAVNRTREVGARLLALMEDNGGFVALNDSSSPMAIKEALQCSKKDFKKAVGNLLKEGKIQIGVDGISLLHKN